MAYIFNKDKNTRVNTLKLIRNCTFEYENEDFLNQILAKEVKIYNLNIKHFLY